MGKMGFVGVMFVSFLVFSDDQFTLDDVAKGSCDCTVSGLSDRWRYWYRLEGESNEREFGLNLNPNGNWCISDCYGCACEKNTGTWSLTGNRVKMRSFEGNEWEGTISQNGSYIRGTLTWEGWDPGTTIEGTWRAERSKSCCVADPETGGADGQSPEGPSEGEVDSPIDDDPVGMSVDESGTQDNQDPQDGGKGCHSR